MKIVRVSGEVDHLQNILTFEEVRKEVGGFVEVVGIGRPQVHSILCNEDGKPLRLPVNVAASTLCGRVLVGNVVVIESQEEAQSFWGEDENE